MTWKMPQWTGSPIKYVRYLRSKQEQRKTCSPQIYKVEGSKNNTYTVSFDTNNNNWDCTCPGYVFRKTCKHISKTQKNIKENKVSLATYSISQEASSQEMTKLVEAFCADKNIQPITVEKAAAQILSKPPVLRPTRNNKGRGRPRTRFNRLITFIKLSDGNLKLAGRGRPKHDEVRLKVDVSFNFNIKQDATYCLKKEGTSIEEVKQ